VDDGASGRGAGDGMKVVLFCGGLGMRIRDVSQDMPKPMIPIGYRPILWHLMKYYAHFGHTDFILCLGYRADVIKRYFLDYEETISNDFVLSGGGGRVELMNRDIADWRITFADTGVNANIGQRLRAAQSYVQGEEVFLANYADGLTDLHLPSLIDATRKSGKIASFVSVRPNLSYHAVSAGADGLVDDITPITRTNLRINGGYFVLQQEIFEYLREGEELVLEPFRRLIEARQLMAYTYDGFFASMDTFRDKQHLDELIARGTAPWEVWRANGRPRAS
jgi:glucose-1-phosphate cytidylyltransferase